MFLVVAIIAMLLKLFTWLRLECESGPNVCGICNAVVISCVAAAVNIITIASPLQYNNKPQNDVMEQAIKGTLVEE